jgi:hypothetical protein
MEVYDPRQNTWTVGAEMPEPAANYALTAYEGLLYLFGGSDGAGALQNVWIYDPEVDTWQSGVPMPLAREGAVAVALTDRIVVLGGRTGEELLTSVQAYYPSRDTNGEDPWLDEIALPQGRADFGAASIYDLVYILGGDRDGDGESGLILTDEKWVPLPVEQEHSGIPTQLLSIGQLLYVLTENEFWSYQAFYYSIYIPFVPQ